MFKLNKEKAIAGESRSSIKVDSGVYSLTIDRAVVRTSSSGTTGIAFEFSSDMGKIYPAVLWVQKNDGTELRGMSILQGLMCVYNIDDTGEKKCEYFNEPATCLSNLSGIECKVALLKVFDWYNNKEIVKNEIQMFFDKDDRTCAEKEMNKLPNQIKYYENLKDKRTDAWLKAMSSSATDDDDADALF